MTSKGVEIERDEVGNGAEIAKGDRVTIRCRIRLNRGELVRDLEEVSFVLGSREVIAGLEKGVMGMRVGGRREFRVSPHLAYRDVGLPESIPPGAMLRFEVAVLAAERAGDLG